MSLSSLVCISRHQAGYVSINDTIYLKKDIVSQSDGMTDQPQERRSSNIVKRKWIYGSNKMKWTNDEFLVGSVFGNTFRVPNDDVLHQWRIFAGFIDANSDNSLIAEQDTYLTGDINFGNEEEEIEI